MDLVPSAANVVASAVVDASASFAVDRIFPVVGELCTKLANNPGNMGVDKGKLQQRLGLLHGVLEDAERILSSRSAIGFWCDDLQHLVYDVENAIEELDYRIKRCNRKGTTLKPDGKMVTKMKEIAEELVKVRSHPVVSLLGGNANDCCCGTKRQRRSFSGRIEPIVYGRDTDREELINFLKANADDQELDVIAIVGMPGMGKTTLARYVYGDKRVDEHFHTRSWVCVSKDFNVLTILKDILEDVTKEQCHFQNPNLIREKVRHELNGKRFLIVLDDLWINGYCEWQTLLSTFSDGGSGSKIIVTTRSREVADRVSTVSKYKRLTCLLKPDCRKLFRKHAGLHPDEEENEKLPLDEMGRQIADRCCGLPLAATMMGRRLRQQRKREWEAVVNSKSLYEKAGDDELMSALKMSYDDLCYPVKRCFTFCSVFADGHKFKKDEMVRMWIGAGLVNPSPEQHQAELGRDYFRQLSSRSLFIEVQGEKKNFVMHSSARDFAKKVSEKTCCIFQEADVSENTLHLSFKLSQFHDMESHFNRQAKWKLRTLLLLGDGSISLGIDSLLEKLSYLRVLSLPNYENELPKTIGDLRLLRYMDFSGSKFEKLPSSIASLLNLEILVLKNCVKLKSLPNQIGGLRDLWYLDISDCSSLSELPRGVEELSRLRMLSNLIVGRENGLSIECLRQLKLLRGRLTIQKMENANIRGPELIEMRLDELTFEWSRQDGSISVQSDQTVLERLQFHADLRKLYIFFYRGSALPNWLVGSSVSLRNLSALKLTECGYATSLHLPDTMELLEELEIVQCPMLEISLPLLKRLRKLIIGNCQGVECRDDEFTLKSLISFKLLGTTEPRQLFTSKVQKGLPGVKLLNIGKDNGEDRQCYPRWALQSFRAIDDLSGEEEMMMQNLCIDLNTEEASLPKWVCNCLYLYALKIRAWKCLTSLPQDRIPINLLELEVLECPSLMSISCPVGLERLQIENCCCLKPPHLDTLTTLKKLKVDLLTMSKYGGNTFPSTIDIEIV